MSPLTSYPYKALSEVRLRHAGSMEAQAFFKERIDCHPCVMGKGAKNMLRKIYGFLGIEVAAARRYQLVCRIWYVHNKDLSEAFPSNFYKAVVEAKRATAMVRDEDI